MFNFSKRGSEDKKWVCSLLTYCDIEGSAATISLSGLSGCHRQLLKQLNLLFPFPPDKVLHEKHDKKRIYVFFVKRKSCVCIPLFDTFWCCENTEAGPTIWGTSLVFWANVWAVHLIIHCICSD